MTNASVNITASCDDRQRRGVNTFYFIAILTRKSVFGNMIDAALHIKVEVKNRTLIFNLPYSGKDFAIPLAIHFYTFWNCCLSVWHTSPHPSDEEHL